MARRNSGRRTDYTWFGSTFFGGAITTGGLGFFTIVLVNASSTLVRVRGMVAARLDAGTTGAAAGILGLGLMIADENQSAVDEVPLPLSNPDGDWLWHQYVPLVSASADTEVGGVRDQVNVLVDSKAMRRVKQSQSLVLISEYSDLSSTQTMAFAGGIRALFGL